MGSVGERISEMIRGATVQGQLDRIKALFITYISEESVVPLRRVLRFTTWGLFGSFGVGVGELLCLLGLLRFLQTQSWCHGHLSWLPYLLTMIGAGALIALTAWRVLASDDVVRRKKK